MTSPATELENVSAMIGITSPATEPVSEKKPSPKGRKTKKVVDVKVKKTSVAAATKKKTVSTHPTYEEMIKDAIVTLKERTGSSQYAIQKFIEEKRKDLPATFRKLLLQNLKRLVASGKLTKVKASFKISSAKPSSPKATKSSPVKKKPTVTVAVSKAKGKVTAASKSKKSSAVKPKTTAARKPKLAAKAKTVPGSKRKAVSAKPKAKPTKVAKTSTVTSPGKKAIATKKKVTVVTKKKTPVKKIVKPKTVKSPAKRASSRAKK